MDSQCGSSSYPLVPRVNASICFAPLCFVPPLLLHPLYPPPQSIVSSSTHDALAVTFVRSFVRSCYSRREHPAVSETSMRDSSSFLDSPLSPLWHLFASPFLLPTRSPPAYSFAELVPSPFPRPRISLANRYFSAAFLPVYTYVYMTWVAAACAYNALPQWYRADARVRMSKVIALLDRGWKDSVAKSFELILDLYDLKILEIICFCSILLRW